MGDDDEYDDDDDDDGDEYDDDDYDHNDDDLDDDGDITQTSTTGEGRPRPTRGCRAELARLTSPFSIIFSLAFIVIILLLTLIVINAQFKNVNSDWFRLCPLSFHCHHTEHHRCDTDHQIQRPPKEANLSWLGCSLSFTFRFSF